VIFDGPLVLLRVADGGVVEKPQGHHRGSLLARMVMDLARDHGSKDVNRLPCRWVKKLAL
jgi:hypothetical protein